MLAAVTTENLFKTMQHFGIQAFGLNNGTNVTSCTPLCPPVLEGAPFSDNSKYNALTVGDLGAFCEFRERVPMSLASEFL